MAVTRSMPLKDILKSVLLYPNIQQTKLVEDVPLLYREPHVLSGYRVNHKSWSYYHASLFQVHNETLNVWSHAIAFFIFVYLTYDYGQEFDYINDNRTWPLLGFALGTMCYALCSSFAHLYHSKSELTHYTCFQLDYVGIGMNALGNSIFAYYLTSNESFHKTFGPYFFLFNPIFSFLTCVGCTVAKLRYKRPYPLQRKLLQMCSVGLQSLYGSIPILHKIFQCLLDSQCPLSDISLHLQYGFWFLVATILYSSHIPERFSPGSFDIVGFGHQLFHVVMAYTTCLQFRAAAWEIRRRPSQLTALFQPTLWGVFGTIAMVLIADVLFVIFTHPERVKRGRLAKFDFNGAIVKSSGDTETVKTK